MENIFSELLSHYSEVTYIKGIRSGKEASIHLVKADGILCALKIYKENLKYSTQLNYMQLSEIGDKRTSRAIKNKSSKGKSALSTTWTNREFKTMALLSTQSFNIPEVYLAGSNFILMQFIGVSETPAPRLSDISLNQSEAIKCFTEIIQNICIFIENDFVHGDLSEYNILWHNNTTYIIDFPQIVTISKNSNAYEKLLTDLRNIRKYFSRYNIPLLEREIDKVINQFMQEKIYG